MNNRLIIWSEIHETGICIIDEQHQSIVGTINSLFYFMRRNQGTDILLPTLALLEELTKIHFLTEESLLQEAGYPALDEHARAHRVLRNTMRRVSLRCRQENDPGMLLTFLKAWWLKHINVQDHLYAEFLRKQLNG